MTGHTTRLLLLLSLMLGQQGAGAQEVPVRTLDKVSAAMVKIYGAGGFSGLEAYQSGVIVSDSGRIVTVDSLVLEPGDVTVVAASGDRYSGQVVGADPLLRVAVVQIDPAGETLPAIDLESASPPEPGEPLLAFSNLFNIATGDEPVSVMRTALGSSVSRRSVFGPQSPLGADRVLLVDAVTSNPGAAGGLITDYSGRPVGLIGAERQGFVTGGWVNYALPAAQVAASVSRIVRGEKIANEDLKDARPVDLLEHWGFTLVESVARRTPPYVEHVQPNSAADQAGIRADDLIVMVEGLVSASTREVQRLLAVHAKQAELTLTIQRNDSLIELQLGQAPGGNKEGAP